MNPIDKIKAFEEWLYELDEQELLSAREDIVKSMRDVAKATRERDIAAIKALQDD